MSYMSLLSHGHVCYLSLSKLKIEYMCNYENFNFVYIDVN